MKGSKTLLFFVFCTLVGCKSTMKMPVAIAPTNLQVLYNGFENPITYIHEGVPCDELILDCDTTKASINKRSDCKFSITPYGAWKEGLHLSIYWNEKSPDNLLEKQHLRIARMPRPHASLTGKTGGTISKAQLNVVRDVSITLYNVIFEGLRYHASSYSYLLVRKADKKVIDRGRVEGHAIPPHLRGEFHKLQNGDLIHIYDIEARSSTGSVTSTENDITLWVK